MDALDRGSRGAAAGVVATAAMSALMLAAGRLGLLGRQPPQAIAEQAVEVVTDEPVPSPVGRALGVLTHLAFGAGAGAGYALLPRWLPPRVRGCGWALGIYGAAYQGWVPALGALPPADRDRRDRVTVMVLAHLVYGTVLASTEQALRRRPRGPDLSAGGQPDRRTGISR